MARHAPAEPLVVLTEQLTAALREWIDIEDRNLRPYSSARTLSERAGVSMDVIRRVMQQRTKHTTLSLADTLLTATGQTHLLQDGTIEVLANPSFKSMWETRMKERGITDPQELLG